MRLLQQDDGGHLSLVEFVGNRIPPYAILSHTWSQTSKEVTFDVFMSGDLAENLEYAESYKKIRGCGEQAKRDGLKHFWVDTCCINKESSAELSEAINSMYAWYRDADVCYAYLHDVHNKAEFQNSRWFSRGWTLQELIAPADVVFFDAAWSPVGYKTSLIETLSRHTGINIQALHSTAKLNELSIAEKMSWAACRQTSRIEDEAYCLMGLFDVNMPLIYGEGKRAFLRLQEELLKTTNDSSILAYIAHKAIRSPSIATSEASDEDEVQEAFDPVESDISDENSIMNTTGFFATSPSMFQHSTEYIPHPILRTYSLSQEGIPTHARIRRSGHLIEMSALLWEPVDLRWSSTYSDRTSMMAFSTHIEREYGLSFTLRSIRKLALCSQVYSQSYYRWGVAFLDCRRRDGGIVGIVVLQDFNQGTCTRLHFPSIVETTSSSFNRMTALKVCNFHFDTDEVKHDHRYLGATEKGPQIPRNIVYREANFCEYGLKTLDKRPYGWAEYRPTGTSDIPHIVLKPRYHGLYGDIVIDCSMFAGVETKVSNSTSKAWAKVYAVPTNRGSTTYLALTDDLQLVIRGRMQWDHSMRPGIECASKQCLLTLYIEEKQHSTDESVLLDDEAQFPGLWRRSLR